MKQFYKLLITLLITSSVYSQTESYDFSLELIGENATTGNYQIALVATPDVDVNNQLCNDLGAMISVPTGYTIGNFQNGNSGIAASEFNSEAFGNSDAGDPVFYVNRLPPTTNIFFNFTAGTAIRLVIFELIGAALPTSGDSVILVPESDSARLGFLENFINISTDNRYNAISTPSSISFSTLSIEDNFIEGLALYPNPTQGGITISLDIEKVIIFDVVGKEVFTALTNEFDISDLSDGVYFAHIYTSKGKDVVKVVKE